MSYINKALKDFTNQLKNDYQMEINTSKADTTGGKKDYSLSVDLSGDNSKVLVINFNHCTKEFLHSQFCENGRYYYTPWIRFNDEEKEMIKYAKKHNLPAIQVEISIWDMSGDIGRPWRIGGGRFLLAGYQCFTGDNYEYMKELVEATIECFH